MHIYSPYRLQDDQDTRMQTSPLADNTGQWVSYWAYSTLREPIDFWVYRSSVKNNTLHILLEPTQNPYTSIVYQGQTIPINLDHIDLTQKHTISVLKWDTRFKTLEHISSVSSALRVHFDIHISWDDNWPFPTNSMSDFAEKILANKTEANMPMKYFTVDQSVKIQFDNKLGSYIILMPDNGTQTLSLDIMVDYPGSSIGKQRIITDINPDIFMDKISWARTNAYGSRQRILWRLNTFPFLKNLSHNFDYQNVFAFTKSRLINPKPEFFTESGIYSEVMYHAVMDMLWALAIDIKRENTPGHRFVWRIITFANSHENDIAMLRMLESGEIPTHTVSQT